MLPHQICAEVLLLYIREDERAYTPRRTEVTDGVHVHRSLPQKVVSANTLFRTFRQPLPFD
jgi:hypothetical protein